MPLNRYLRDYETVVSKDEEGNQKETLKYVGDYFEFSHDAEGIRRFQRNSLIVLGVIAALHVTAGFIGNPGMYQLYIALPYVFAFLPIYLLAAAFLRLPLKNSKHRRDEIEPSYNRIRPASLALQILLLIGILGQILFMIFASQRGNLTLDLVYLVMEILAAGAAYYLVHSQKPIQVVKSSEA